MTGTERAAMRLALGVLRRATASNADDALDAVHTILALADSDLTLPSFRHVTGRILRARLALYLRAVLRADEAARWDAAWGQWPVPQTWPAMRCTVCGERRFSADEVAGTCRGQAAAWAPPRPLWTTAPSKEPTR